MLGPTNWIKSKLRVAELQHVTPLVRSLSGRIIPTIIVTIIDLIIFYYSNYIYLLFITTKQNSNRTTLLVFGSQSAIFPEEPPFPLPPASVLGGDHLLRRHYLSGYHYIIYTLTSHFHSAGFFNFQFLVFMHKHLHCVCIYNCTQISSVSFRSWI